jgi:uncharacterized linocin/CFP29 family protein
MYGLQQPLAQAEAYAMTPTLSRISSRDKVAWPPEVWERIDEAVHAECQRIGIAAKFLPMYGPIEVTKTYVLADIVRTDQPTLNVDETDTRAIVEIQFPFELTRQQVEEEEDRGTAVTLATRAANLLTQGMDQLIFRGADALSGDNPLFRPGLVELKSGRQGVGVGLVNLPNSRPDRLVVPVPALEARPGDTQTRWGENTFAGVARAYSILQSGFDSELTQAHYGPYCCILQHVQFADTFAPLATTLIMPADRIKPLVNDCFYGTGTLPEFRGFLISTGGNTVDLVVVCPPTVAWVQEDGFGNVRFRVYEKFVVREKVNDCVVRLEFEQTPRSTSGGPP